MTTATTGTGTITLGSAVSGYLTFALAGVANADVIDYAIKDGSNSEIGTGTYTSSGTTLTRTVTKSTNSNTAISLSGTAEVFITPRAETLNDPTALFSNASPNANKVLQGDSTTPWVTNGRKLLNTLTASSSATLDDTTSITSAFQEYEIILQNILPASNNISLALQVQVSGSFQSSSYLSSVNNSNGSAVGSTSLTTGILIGPTLLVPNTQPGVAARYYLSNPAQTSNGKQIFGTYSIGSLVGMGGGVYTGSAAAVTGIRLLASSGNLTSGVMKIYGLS